MISPTSSFRFVYNPAFFKKKKNIFLSKAEAKHNQSECKNESSFEYYIFMRRIYIVHIVYIKNCFLKNSPLRVGKSSVLYRSGRDFSYLHSTLKQTSANGPNGTATYKQTNILFMILL